jgi:hypothetical protein
MKPELVCVTTFQREELLFLCLEAIRREDAQIPIHVFSDRGAWTKDLAETCAKFEAVLAVMPATNSYGNSENVLNACKWATENASEVVHLIEDDTIIHAGYLDWARNQLGAFVLQAHSATMPLEVAIKMHGERYAAVCGRSASPHITNWYDAPCASWNVYRLHDAINHVIPEYFAPSRAEMQKVLDEKMFPKSKYRKGGAEQDGFFLRCIEFYKWKTKFPPKPLATHQGAWGYNRPTHKRPTGSFEERIAWCRKLLTDRDARIKLFGRQVTDAEMHRT